MTRSHSTTPRRRRRREFVGMAGVVVLAAGAGLLAAHFGTHQAWENAPTTTSSSTSVPFVDPSRIP